MKVLVTGGAGFIGSHMIVALQEAGHEVVSVDNYSNSKPTVYERVFEITNKPLVSYVADLSEPDALDSIFSEHQFDAVIHFAALKAVGESVSEPLLYYKNNLSATLNLLKAVEEFAVETLIFSSSATVYGAPDELPIQETADANRATNPYGQTKVFGEQMIRDFALTNPELHKNVILRYFNPIGAHQSGKIGEDPSDTPNNLVPYVMQVAVGKLAELQVFGDDYDTADGTGVRDYIHVVDLARGHVAALRKLADDPGVHTWNLGTGNGTSVLEIVAAASRAVGHDIPYKVVGRRPGDLATSFADPTKAQDDLGWRAERTIDNMVHDHWNWQSANPDGYGD